MYPAHFFFFPTEGHDRSSCLVSHPKQASQLREKKGGRSCGPQRRFSAAPVSKAISPYSYCEVGSKCQEWQLGYKAKEDKVLPLKVKTTSEDFTMLTIRIPQNAPKDRDQPIWKTALGRAEVYEMGHFSLRNDVWHKAVLTILID